MGFFAWLLGKKTLPEPEKEVEESPAPKFIGDEPTQGLAEKQLSVPVSKEIPPETAGDFVVLDVETRRSSKEVGGWDNAAEMGVSVAVLYDSRTEEFWCYSQDEIPELAEVLASAPLVVGFNILGFDYKVLKPHAPKFNFRKLSTVDILDEIYRRLGHRVSLDNLSSATLGVYKSSDGLQALEWWKEGRIDLIAQYCRKDVEITRDLFLYGRKNGHLFFPKLEWDEERWARNERYGGHERKKRVNVWFGQNIESYLLYRASVSKKTVQILKDAGLLSPERIRNATDKDLLAIPGVGIKILSILRKAEKEVARRTRKSS